MGLLDLDPATGEAKLNPDILAIPAFDTIWKADKTKTKAKAMKNITYVYMMADFNSPYAVFPLVKRKTEVARDILGSEDSKIEKMLLEGIETYKKFQETPSMYLLEKTKTAIYKMADYFETVNFNQMDDTGRPVYTAKDVAANLEKIGKIIESYDKVEEKVKKEVKSESRIRGGGTEGSYER
jgi:hypothetical protein